MTAKPKPKRVYWRADVEGYEVYAVRTNDARVAEAWRENGYPVVKVTVYSAREIREWERQREAEIRREERDTARQIRALREAERANLWPNLPAEDWSKHMPADAASVATPPPRVTAEDWDKIHAAGAEAQAIGESLDAIRSRFGLETPPADPIAAIRARHDAVEQRREWTSTVVTSDGERAHLDRGELLDIVCKVIGGER